MSVQRGLEAGRHVGENLWFGGGGSNRFPFARIHYICNLFSLMLIVFVRTLIRILIFPVVTDFYGFSTPVTHTQVLIEINFQAPETL